MKNALLFELLGIYCVSRYDEWLDIEYLTVKKRKPKHYRREPYRYRWGWNNEGIKGKY